MELDKSVALRSLLQTQTVNLLGPNPTRHDTSLLNPVMMDILKSMVASWLMFDDAILSNSSEIPHI